MMISESHGQLRVLVTVTSWMKICPCHLTHRSLRKWWGWLTANRSAAKSMRDLKDVTSTFVVSDSRGAVLNIFYIPRKNKAFCFLSSFYWTSIVFCQWSLKFLIGNILHSKQPPPEQMHHQPGSHDQQRAVSVSNKREKSVYKNSNKNYEKAMQLLKQQDQ